ncbi:MAG: cation:proton antiporter [Ardenticatenia bacterium]|nr:cation:proton antiporter [Ardenticatenia bacterium]
MLITLLVVAAVLAVAGLCGRLAARLGQPPVIGELVAGIALGPSILGAVLPDLATRLFTPPFVTVIDRVAQAAVLVFMFWAGLELDTVLLRRHAGGVVRIALGSLALPFALGAGFALWLYPALHGEVANRAAFVLFVGTAMSITAMPVLTRILSDCRLLTSPIGTVALGCAAIDDVVAWTMLGFVVGMLRGQADIAVTVASAMVYLLLMLYGLRPALRWLAARSAGPGRRPLWLGIAAAAALLSAMAAERIGIHAVLGAFIAGACLPRDGDALAGLGRPLHAVSVLLLPAFFVQVGLRTQLGLVTGLDQWAVVGLLILLAGVGKVGGSSVAARSVGFSWRDSLAIGALLNTRGLVALVALDIGRGLGILSPTLFTMFVIMTLLMTLATVPVLRLLGLGAWEVSRGQEGAGSMPLG